MSRLIQEEPVPEQGANLAYFLDVDGTLLSIAASPELAVPTGALCELLMGLARACEGALALVSGRPLRELDRMFTPQRFPTAAQHGAELRFPDGRVTWWETHLPALHAIGAKLRKLAASDARIRIEDKGLAIAVHFRSAPQLGKRLAPAMLEMLAPYPTLRLQPGKCVLEVCAADSGKGRAVENFMHHPPFAGRKPVYIGDDLTDESGFTAVNNLNGVSIKVGSEATVAQYRLPDPSAVRAWLGKRMGTPSA